MTSDSMYGIIRYCSDEDQAVIAEVPELPGYAAGGSTYREGLANVEIVIQDWVSAARFLSRDVPKPRGRFG